MIDHAKGYDILDALREQGTLIERLQTLLPRERDVLALAYGLSWKTGVVIRAELSHEAIGKLYMVTRERVRQIESNALRRLAEGNEEKTWLELHATDTELCYMISCSDGCEKFCPLYYNTCSVEKHCKGLISALLKKYPLKGAKNTLEKE